MRQNPLNIGDGATVGAIDGGNLDSTGTMTVAAGQNVTVPGNVSNLGPADSSLTFGDNAVVGGNITGANQADTFSIGDNWGLANINLSSGDDRLTMGFQNPAASLSQIDGGSTTDTDTIALGLRTDQEADFIAAGWKQNPNGSWSPSGPAQVISGNLAVRDFEGAPCFAPGTLIETPDGLRAVEKLRVGDLVVTADHGPQPLR